MSVYNAERYVEDAVESILRQTRGDFDFHIFSDGSTGRSTKILKGYASITRNRFLLRIA
jgi:glycosyltransferase involved in cell wall biosynthesis